MATSLPPIESPQGVFVDIYAETGIAVGTAIVIQNIGANNTRLTESAGQPTIEGYNILKRQEYLTNTTGNVGAWSYSPAGTLLQVQEA